MAGARSVVEVEVVDVVEFDVGESYSAASAVLEIDLFESFGDDPTHLLVAGPVLRASNRRCAYAGGRCTVSRRKRPSSVVPTGAVYPNRALVSTVIPPEVGGLLLPALADLWLPPLPYCVVDLRGDVGAGVLAGAAPVAVHGVGGDPELLPRRPSRCPTA